MDNPFATQRLAALLRKTVGVGQGTGLNGGVSYGIAAGGPFTGDALPRRRSPAASEMASREHLRDPLSSVPIPDYRKPPCEPGPRAGEHLHSPLTDQGDSAVMAALSTSLFCAYPGALTARATLVPKTRDLSTKAAPVRLAPVPPAQGLAPCPGSTLLWVDEKCPPTRVDVDLQNEVQSRRQMARLS